MRRAGRGSRGGSRRASERRAASRTRPRIKVGDRGGGSAARHASNVSPPRSSTNHRAPKRTWATSSRPTMSWTSRPLLVIADRAESFSEGARVFEVRAFEPEAHRRDERYGVRARWYALPEPISDVEITHRGAQPLDLARVRAHVARFILCDAEEAGAKRSRRVGERQDRPRHQLCRLKLVMQERVQRTGAARWAREPARPRPGRHARRREARAGRDLGMLDPSGGRARPPTRGGSGRRRKLVRERDRMDEVPRPALNRSGRGLEHVRTLPVVGAPARPVDSLDVGLSSTASGRRVIRERAQREPPHAMRSPFWSFRPRRRSTSPFTFTLPLWTSTFACPPLSAAPRSLRNWSSRIVGGSAEVMPSSTPTPIPTIGPSRHRSRTW